MRLWEITTDCLNAIERGYSKIAAVLEEPNVSQKLEGLDEFNSEKAKIERFKTIKCQLLELLHVCKIAKVLIPNSYANTLEITDSVSNRTQKLIDLMGACIEEPSQRDSVLQFIDRISEGMKEKKVNMQEFLDKLDKLDKDFNEYFEEVPLVGLSKVCPLPDKFRYILDICSEQEIEEMASEQLPSFLKSCRDFDTSFDMLNDAGIRLS